VKLVIVTGVSGAGKSTALRALEDLDYYCADNLPLPLLPKFVELLSIALDASVTHLYAPGTRRHSRASLPPVA